jgi:inner membrane protein
MDNLTHSVTGLAIGELVDRCLPPEPDSALARVRHRLLLVSCWAASNFPDLDLVLTPLAPRPLGYLLQHRGHTHTLLGLLPQALLLLALVWLLWPRARGLLRASPTARGATIGVIAVGLLLHIGMDYLNVYGVHPFYPFDARWVYGDMVFIVEPAFWVLLGTPLAMLCGRTARRLWMGALALVLLTASYLGYLKWGSLLALAVAGFVLAWLQRRLLADAERPRRSPPRALLAGFALLGVFLAGQAIGEQRARALVERQPGTGRLLDVALSAFAGQSVVLVVCHSRNGRCRTAINFAARPAQPCAGARAARLVQGAGGRRGIKARRPHPGDQHPARMAVAGDSLACTACPLAAGGLRA